jgi:hypothetical protein
MDLAGMIMEVLRSVDIPILFPAVKWKLPSMKDPYQSQLTALISEIITQESSPTVVPDLIWLPYSLE